MPVLFIVDGFREGNKLCLQEGVRAEGLIPFVMGFQVINIVL
jgi:hypothetical protein